MSTWVPIRERDFIGYDDRISSEFLKPGYLADALNCFCIGGEIVKRMGYSLIGSDVGSSACQGIKGVRFADGTKKILAVFGGSIYQWTGSGSFTLVTGGSGVLDTSRLVDIVAANNAVYFFDGLSTVPKYTLGTDAITTVAAIPKGNFARWFHGQLHVAGIDGSPNNLKSSDIGNPENFSSGAFSSLDINANDGDYISGLNELKDELMVFKTNRVWSLSGFGTTALTADDINEKVTGIGTLSNWSIVNTGNDLIYISFLGNIPHFRSLQRSRYGTVVDDGIISLDIEGTMQGLNKAQLSKISGVFDGKYLWQSVPNGSSTTNNLVLTMDMDTKGWTRHTGINASSFDVFAISTQPQMYFGEARADSKAYVLDSSKTDNGTAISFQIITRRYGGSHPELKKKYKYLYINGVESGDFDMAVDYSIDGFSYSNLDTFNFSGSGSIFDNIILDTSRLGETTIKRDRFVIPKSRCYYIEFKMYESSTTSEINIRNWEVIFQFKKRPIDI